MWMMAAWQGLQSDSISAGNTKWLMIFVGITAFSMLIQAVVVIAAVIGAAKTQKRVLEIAEELRAKANPIIDKAEILVSATMPKISKIADNLLETSELVKAKARELDATISDVNVRTKAQVARVDGMVSTALTATGALAEIVHSGIRTPLKEVSGVINAFKAGIDVLVGRSTPKGKSVALIKIE